MKYKLKPIAVAVVIAVAAGGLHGCGGNVNVKATQASASTTTLTHNESVAYIKSLINPAAADNFAKRTQNPAYRNNRPAAAEQFKQESWVIAERLANVINVNFVKNPGALRAYKNEVGVIQKELANKKDGAHVILSSAPGHFAQAKTFLDKALTANDTIMSQTAGYEAKRDAYYSVIAEKFPDFLNKQSDFARAFKVTPEGVVTPLISSEFEAEVQKPAGDKLFYYAVLKDGTVKLSSARGGEYKALNAVDTKLWTVNTGDLRDKPTEVLLKNLTVADAKTASKNKMDAGIAHAIRSHLKSDFETVKGAGRRYFGQYVGMNSYIGVLQKQAEKQLVSNGVLKKDELEHAKKMVKRGVTKAELISYFKKVDGFTNSDFNKFNHVFTNAKLETVAHSLQRTANEFNTGDVKKTIYLYTRRGGLQADLSNVKLSDLKYFKNYYYNFYLLNGDAPDDVVSTVLSMKGLPVMQAKIAPLDLSEGELKGVVNMLEVYAWGPWSNQSYKQKVWEFEVDKEYRGWNVPRKLSSKILRDIFPDEDTFNYLTLKDLKAQKAKSRVKKAKNLIQSL